jgi:O-acetylserine/cysteine efflux transporter
VRAWHGTLLLALAILLWGSAFRAHAVGAGHAPPLAFAALRVAPAALLLSALALVAGRGLTGHQAVWAAITGLLMVAATLGGVSEAIPRVGAAETAVIFNSYPFFVLVVGTWVLHERLSGLGVVGVCTGFAGLVVLVSTQSEAVGGPSDPVAGAAIAAAAAVAWGIGTIAVARLLRGEVEVLAFTAVQHFAGGAVLIVAAIPVLGDVDWGSRDLWLAAGWVSVGSSAVASLAFFAALRRMTAARASTWQFLVPTVAVLIEGALGVVPERLALIGMAISILGVAVVSISDQSAVPTPEAA